MTSGSGKKIEASAGHVTIPVKGAVFVVTALVMAGLAGLFYETFNMPPPLLEGYPGDAFFPRLVLAFTAIWGFIILLRGVVTSSTGSDEAGEAFQFHWGEFAFVIFLVAAYALLLEPLGFEIATFAFLMLLLVPRLLSRTPAWIAFALGAAALATLILWATFGLALKVQLPLKFLPLFFY